MSDNYKTIDPAEVPVSLLHSQLLAAVAPRPIAFASTVDKDGNPNLSPFSFFNVFSAKPPIAIFSPARRVRDNTSKHTLENVLEVPEVVINIVDYSMVQQVSLASTEYPKGVDEFLKSGLTPVPSEKIKPFRVAESPVQLECKVKEVISLGDNGGAGNLVICEIVLMHINSRVLNGEGKIDQHKMDHVARLGYNWYSRVTPESLFEVPKPLTTLGIGVDELPESIKRSNILTGNDLGMLGNTESLPSKEDTSDYFSGEYKGQKPSLEESHQKAKRLLESNDVEKALKELMIHHYDL